MKLYKIKLLKWVKRITGKDIYRLSIYNENWIKLSLFDTLAEAKKAAEEDYLETIKDFRED